MSNNMPFWESWPQYTEDKEKKEMKVVFGDLEKAAIKHGVSDIVEQATVSNTNLWVLDWRKKEEIVNYILDWNLATGKNDELENIVKKACEHPSAADLKYLMEHAEYPVKDNLVALAKEKERERKMREEAERRYQAAKKKAESEATTSVPTKKIPEAKLKPSKDAGIIDRLSTGASQIVGKMADVWKSINDRLIEAGNAVAEGARQAAEKAKEKVSEILELFDPSKIFSSKYEVNRGTTMCSRTAYKNARQFWVNIPAGNAYAASIVTPTDKDHYKRSVPEDKAKTKPRNSWATLNTDTITWNKDVNFADIYVSSSSKYGHRAVAFKWDDTWYVLDPYRAWGRSTKPIPMDVYASKNRILKAHLYNAPWTKSTWKA